jgi:hypothetical protein
MSKIKLPGLRYSAIAAQNGLRHPIMTSPIALHLKWFGASGGLKITFLSGLLLFGGGERTGLPAVQPTDSSVSTVGFRLLPNTHTHPSFTDILEIGSLTQFPEDTCHFLPNSFLSFKAKLLSDSVASEASRELPWDFTLNFWETNWIDQNEEQQGSVGNYQKLTQAQDQLSGRKELYE